MRYAVISDIHGNIRALEAVIKDAEALQCEEYLVLGDILIDFPFPNECVDAIRALNARVVRGNREDYFRYLDENGDWYGGSDQFAPMAWNASRLREDNMRWLAALPIRERLHCQGHLIHMRHSFEGHFGVKEFGHMCSQVYREHSERKPIGPIELHETIKYEILGNEEFMFSWEEKPLAIFLFGHTHVQWYFKRGTRGREILLNPGSCGMPLDYNPNASYTILDITDRRATVTERRVSYDNKSAADSLISSELYGVSPIWGGIRSEQVLSAKDLSSGLMGELERRAAEEGIAERPYPNEFWNRVGAEWLADNLKR